MACRNHVFKTTGFVNNPNGTRSKIMKCFKNGCGVTIAEVITTPPRGRR